MSRKNTELKNNWENHIHQWSQSGKSQTEYCREHNLSIKSFCYWKRKFKKLSDNNFVEIKRASGRVTPSTLIEVISPDGILVRFQEDISTSSLKNIMSILRS